MFYINFWKKYFDFKGTTTRYDQYWTNGINGTIIILLLMGLLKTEEGALNTFTFTGDNSTSMAYQGGMNIFMVLLIGFIIAVAIPTMSMTVRRFRAIGFQESTIMLFVIIFAAATVVGLVTFTNPATQSFGGLCFLVDLVIIGISMYNNPSKSRRINDAGLAAYRNKNYAEAVRQWEQSARMGNQVSVYNLGSYYRDVEKNYDKAREYFLQAEKQGYNNAKTALAKLEDIKKRDLENKSYITDLETKVAQGDADAQNKLGVAYYKGAQGLPQDFTKAIELFRKAAAQNDAVAQDNLGNAYRAGNGVEKDETEAVRLYQLSAAQGYALAQNYLGVMYYQGLGVAQDYQKAFEWNLKAAEQGISDAQNNIGGMFASGIGTEVNFEQAERWYKASAAQGKEDAKKSLENLPSLKQKYAESQAFKATVSTNTPEEKYALGQKFEKGDGVSVNVREALKWFELSAKEGYAQAQVRMGNICHGGGKVVAKDDKKAVEWYQKAADQGYAQGLINLAAMYRGGMGVEKNEAEAVKLYLLAAQNGSAEAQHSLAFMYFKGLGIERDDIKSFEWQKKSAEQGLSQGQSDLGYYYENGIGVEKNTEEANHWYQLATAQGNENAKKSLERLKKTAEPVTKAVSVEGVTSSTETKEMKPTKKEWQEFFQLVNNRQPTLDEFTAARNNQEFR